MEDREPSSASVGLTIREPGKILGAIWLVLGLLLVIAFFLPNYEMAGMDLSGPKVIDMVLRKNADLSRIFDDGGFFMMVAVPIMYLILGFGGLALGIWMLLRKRSAALVMAIWSALGFLFTLVGDFVIERSQSDLPFFTKLLPHPTAVYWLALVMQLFLCLSSIGYLLLMRKSSTPA